MAEFDASMDRCQASSRDGPRDDARMIEMLQEAQVEGRELKSAAMPESCPPIDTELANIEQRLDELQRNQQGAGRDAGRVVAAQVPSDEALRSRERDGPDAVQADSRDCRRAAKRRRETEQLGEQGVEMPGGKRSSRRASCRARLATSLDLGTISYEDQLAVAMQMSYEESRV